MFHRDAETLKESFVHDVGTNEATVIRTLTLGICSGDDVETSSGSDHLVDLLEIDGFTLKNRLQAHHLVRTKIDFIEQKNCTTFHRDDHRTILPHGTTIDKAETTKQIVFVSFDSDVNTNHIALLSSANLFDHHGLTVTRKTCDIHRIVLTRLDDLTNVIEVAEWHITSCLLRHQTERSDSIALCIDQCKSHIDSRSGF